MTIATAPRYRDALPQLTHVPFLTDGGIETTLIFHEGHDLPFFAAYDLLARDGGEEALRRYFEPYVRMARDRGLGIVLETATWRANVDWAERLGHTPEQLDGLNRAAVSLLVALREEHQSGKTPIVISGCVGPRGDGYVVGDAMSAAEAAVYHSQQIRTLCDAGVDLVTGLTMTYADEAVGIVQAASGAALPVVISFTVETDGRLPSGQPLREAIEEVDDRTSAGACLLHDQLCASVALLRRARAGLGLDGAHPRRPRQRLPPEPRRARRDGIARQRRPGGARQRVRRAP